MTTFGVARAGKAGCLTAAEREEDGVLTLTDTAVEVIRNLTTQPGLPDQTGLRITAHAENGSGAGFMLALSQGPDLGDEVIEARQVRVFVQPDAAAVLGDKMLDAEVNEQGEIAFLVVPKPPSA
jgi:Fe-S cluster assembly iron-binding protein IscA